MCVCGGGGGGGWEQSHFTWDSNWLATSLLTPAVVEALSPVKLTKWNLPEIDLGTSEANVFCGGDLLWLH